MKKGLDRNLVALSLGSLISLGLWNSIYASIRSPEQDTLAISKYLKPIPDNQWESIAGPKISENYSIVKGDTLYDISNRLFGDSKYWPKIWALNNKIITNPHWIKPGNVITFSGGSGVSLPSVTLAQNELAAAGIDAGQIPGSEAETMTDVDDHFTIYPGTKKKRSKEWKKLSKQPWEQYTFSLGAETDKYGFDKSTKVVFKTVKGFEHTALVSTEKPNPIAEITAGRDLSSNFTTNDTVYLFSDGNLQIGDMYTVLKRPHVLHLKDSDRTGFATTILGQVKVTGVRDDLFIGNVVWSRDTIPRGSYLVPLVPRYGEPDPIPAETAVEGVLMTSPDLSTRTVSQGATVFIDRGEEDGVKPGMIFRAYQHYDPYKKSKITTGNYLIDGDIQVTMTSPKFSMGIILSSRIPLSEGAEVILLTDISEFLRNREMREKSLELEKGKNNELDELDQLDSQEGLGKSEEKELKQLERWIEKPAKPAQPEPAPSGAPLAPSEAPPPPPETTPAPGPTPEMAPPSDVQFPSMESPAPPVDTLPPPVEAVPDTLPPPPAGSTPPSGEESKALDQLLGQ